MQCFNEEPCYVPGYSTTRRFQGFFQNCSRTFYRHSLKKASVDFSKNHFNGDSRVLFWNWYRYTSRNLSKDFFEMLLETPSNNCPVISKGIVSMNSLKKIPQGFRQEYPEGTILSMLFIKEFFRDN